MRGLSRKANRMFALFIFLLLIVGYLGFFLVPAVSQGTLQAMLVLTSNPNEIALMVIGIMMIVLAFVAMTKGQEDWTTKDDSGLRSVRGYLPETGHDAKVLLREALLKKVRLVMSLTQDELDEMPRMKLLELIHDDELSRLLDDDCKEMSENEIRRLMRKIERFE